jgi:hypothetical protein
VLREPSGSSTDEPLASTEVRAASAPASIVSAPGTIALEKRATPLIWSLSWLLPLIAIER